MTEDKVETEDKVKTTSQEKWKEEVPEWVREHTESGLTDIAISSAIMPLEDPAVLGKTLETEDVDGLEEDEFSVIVSFVKVKPEKVEENLDKMKTSLEDVFQVEI